MQKKLNCVGIFVCILLIVVYTYTTWMRGGLDRF